LLIYMVSLVDNIDHRRKEKKRKEKKLKEKKGK
jgi:hypothetical protein